MSSEQSSAAGSGPAPWTFLSNHAHVLLCLAREPEILLSDVARRVGITERAVQRIVADLEAAGYIARTRVGRHNRYRVDPNRPLRHPIEAHRNVDALLELVAAGAARGSRSRPITVRPSRRRLRRGVG